MATIDAHRARVMALGLSLLLVSCATPLVERDWHLARSRNFEVACSVERDRCEALVTDLERFRGLVERITTAPSVDSPVPSSIFVFQNGVQYGHFGGPAATAGFFSNRISGNLVGLRDVAGAKDAAGIILHEYTHFLLRNGSSTQYPLWYDEGFAELLSTVTERDEALVIGSPPPYGLVCLDNSRWIPIGKVLSARGYDGWSLGELNMLYAESWALVHYLFFGRPGGAAFGTEMQRYLALLETGRSDAESFAEAFGIAIEELDEAIGEYVDRPTIGVRAISLESLGLEASEVDVDLLAPAEIATRLGHGFLLSSRSKRAEAYFRRALETEPERAAAHAGLGTALTLQQRDEEAKRHFLRALELEPENPRSHLAYANHFLAIAGRGAAGPEQARLVDLAMRHLERSRDLDPTIPETWARIGQIRLGLPDDPSLALAPLEHAHEMLRSNPEIAELLAVAYARNGRTAEAGVILRRLIAWSHDHEQVARITELLEDLLAESAEQDSTDSGRAAH